MTDALLSGSKERTRRLAGSLRAIGRRVVVAETRDGIAALASRVPRRSIAAYVQLPIDGRPTSLTSAVTDRIESVGLAAPLLTTGAPIVIVAEESDDPVRERRVAIALRLLAEAALAIDSGGGGSVTVIGTAAPDTIARTLWRDGGHDWSALLAGFHEERGYADWRTDILNLTSTGQATYFGWPNQHGQPRVGVLRGSVVSPLPVPAGGPIAWGEEGAAARALAGAMIAEALGRPLVDEALVDLFMKDVVGRLPPGGFEISAAELEAWLRCHLSH
jgi:hypothetical protein